MPILHLADPADITGSNNLLAHYGLEHSFNKFFGKKVKEELSTFLPHLPGNIDTPGIHDNRYTMSCNTLIFYMQNFKLFFYFKTLQYIHLLWTCIFQILFVVLMCLCIEVHIRYISLILHHISYT